MMTDELCCAEKFIGFLDEHCEAEEVDIWGDLQSCIISSVVPQKNMIITKALRRWSKDVPIRSVRESDKGRVDFSQYNGTLGEDRVVCCEAAAAAVKSGTPAIIIDLGTATTINVVDIKDGRCVFRGGAILTGVQTGLTALTKQTAQLPPISNFTNVPLIGGDTHGCLVSGAVFGTICMIEGYIKRIKKELEINPTVIITGGNAHKIIPHCHFPFTHDPSLLLEGLFLLH
jgi:type III pantothenate kinase